MKRAGFAGMVLISCMAATSAMAADLTGHAAASACTFAGQSGLPVLPVTEIEARVASNYSEASIALRDAEVLGSRSPAFLWASETKFQCGKAIGYLAGGAVDEDSVQKCDCFYGRFVKYR